MNAIQRTNESFKNRTQPEHHRCKNDIEEQLDLKCIAQVPLDAMHLVYMGVTKKYFVLLTRSNLVPASKMTKREYEELNKRLLIVRETQPTEFQRRIRSLNHLTKFKSTELRTLLLYAGVVSLRSVVPEHIYQHFLMLSLGIRLLSDAEQFVKNNATAQALLKYFVGFFKNHFGTCLMSYNLHNLLHLPSESLIQNEPLDRFATWTFESANKNLKQFTKRHNGPLEQAYNRVMETYNTVECITPNEYPQLSRECDPTMEDETVIRWYEKIKLDSFEFDVSTRNKWFITKENEIVEFLRACCVNENDFMIFGRIVTMTDDYFQKPIKSSSVGIFVCTYAALQDENRMKRQFSINDIKSKIFMMRNETKFVFTPLI